jgi:hypothetical protein
MAGDVANEGGLNMFRGDGGDDHKWLWINTYTYHF